MGQFLQIAVFVLTAVAVTWVNRSRATRLAGVALILWALISGGAFFFVPFGALVVCEIMLATLMSMVSLTLWSEGDAPRAHSTVMGLCAFDTAFCGLVCLWADTGIASRSIFSYGTNAVFFGISAAIAAPGVWDVVRRRVRISGDLRDDHTARIAKEDSGQC